MPDMPLQLPVTARNARRYFFTRNMSSIVAFAVGCKYVPGNGIYMVGAHTDSPCLKVKPKSKGVKSGHVMLNVEPYGGGLWTTWFDRDLSVAGRLLVQGPDGKLEHKLVCSRTPHRSIVLASKNAGKN
jgi:aspartyl aminopeptidase